MSTRAHTHTRTQNEELAEIMQPNVHEHAYVTQEVTECSYSIDVGFKLLSLLGPCQTNFLLTITCGKGHGIYHKIFLRAKTGFDLNTK